MSRRVESLSAVKSQVGQSAKIFFHWFRHGDLRLHDNPALTQSIVRATEACSSNKHNGILPIFCFDPRIFGHEAKSEFGSLKCGPRRAHFILESVRNLRANLEQNGSGLLVVANVRPENVFETVLRHRIASASEINNILHITCQEEVASEEKKIEQVLESKKNICLEKIWGSTLYNIDDLPYEKGAYDMPDTFTPFRNKVEKNCHIDSLLPTPTCENLELPSITTLDPVIQSLLNYTNNESPLSFMPSSILELGYTQEDLDQIQNQNDVGVMDFVGGESAALARVNEYIWEKDLLKNYFDTRNGMLGADYSTKFSPWLAHGCLSPRYVAQQCAKYEEERIANKSTYWVVFELLWRDFFKFFAQKHGNSIFFLDGTLGRAAHGSHPNSRRWSLDRRHLLAWKNGLTGYPLVDANMRELKATGFMSNRGRQNVCSFLAIDMKTDWRYGADHFEQELLDYDVYSNWGNWCAGAGMTGGRLNRFNIVKQSKDYDCHGEYVRYWCPELQDVPTSLVHEPWKMTAEEQEKYGVKLGRDYPMPIVEPTVYRPQNKDRNKGGKGRKYNKNGGSNGKGQRYEMKSLKQGNYKMH